MSHYEFLSLLAFCLTVIVIYSIGQDKERVAKKALEIIEKIPVPLSVRKLPKDKGE